MAERMVGQALPYHLDNDFLGGRAVLSISNNTGTFIHELGHSIGDLGDEYVEFSGSEPNLAEPTQRNLTKLTRQQMIDQQAKWWNWLTPDYSNDLGDEIGLEEGGGYAEDIFRPSAESIMRNASDGHRFDVVGREAMIIGIYRHSDISTFEDATPEGTYYENHPFFVDPMDPVSHTLDIQWYVDNEPVIGAIGEEFNPANLNLKLGDHTIRVEVVDNTAMVRDEDARAQYLTDSREWTFRRVVTTEADENGSNLSQLSLREALAIAATQSGLDTIAFAPWIDNLVLGSQLSINSDVEIVGPGAGSLTIDGNEGRIFSVVSSVDATIRGMTLTNGKVTGNNHGGAVYNDGSLKLDKVIVDGNEAGQNGGGVFSNGKLHVIDSTFSNNIASNRGGAIATLSNLEDAIVIENSTFYLNQAAGGGAIRLNGSTGGSAKIVQSTFSDNTSTAEGGAISTTSFAAPLTVINSTISSNHADSGLGGGISINGGSVIAHNSIIAANTASTTAGNDIDGGLASGSDYNLLGEQEGSQPGNKVLEDDPGLLSLGDYGGSVKTRPLTDSSPAIDHGNDSLAKDVDNNSLLFDQRRYVRVFRQARHYG